MKNAIGLVIVLALNLGCGAGPAQDSGVKVTQLTDRVYLLSTDQGEYTTNTIAFVGEDGILLVDTQAEDDAEALRLAVDAFGRGTPKYTINTHRHVEHVGGNAIFGEAPIVSASFRIEVGAGVEEGRSGGDDRADLPVDAIEVGAGLSCSAGAGADGADVPRLR